MHKLAKAAMPIVIAVTLLILGTATASMAGACINLPRAPEIDVATGASAVALLSGAVLIIRGRRKK